MMAWQTKIHSLDTRLDGLIWMEKHKLNTRHVFLLLSEKRRELLKFNRITTCECNLKRRHVNRFSSYKEATTRAYIFSSIYSLRINRERSSFMWIYFFITSNCFSLKNHHDRSGWKESSLYLCSAFNSNFIKQVEMSGNWQKLKLLFFLLHKGCLCCYSKNVISIFLAVALKSKSSVLKMFI